MCSLSMQGMNSRQKYETLMKEKTLLRIDRDRLAKQLELQGSTVDTPDKKISNEGKKQGNTKSWSAWPSQTSISRALNWSGTATSFSCHSSVNHTDCAISRIIPHESSSLLTCGDHGNIRLISSLSPSIDSEIIGVHERTFASGLAYHPQSDRVISSGGNGEIKVWNSNIPVHTWNDHRSCVWSLDVVEDYLVTASMDQTAKLIDMHVGRCRHTLRGHLDSVNKAVFCRNNPSNILTCSADKSVSLWDCRTAHCAWTLFEHSSAVSDVKGGDLIASCDLGGCVVISDPRMGVLEKITVDSRLNELVWLTGKTLAAAGSGLYLITLGSPENAVQASLWDADILSLAVMDSSKLVAADERGRISVWS